MYYIEETLSAFITVVSLALMFISFLAYRRKGNRKLLFIAAAFVLFFIEGLVLSAALFLSGIKDNLMLFVSILTSGILLFLYISVVKK